MSPLLSAFVTSPIDYGPSATNRQVFPGTKDGETGNYFTTEIAWNTQNGKKMGNLKLEISKRRRSFTRRRGDTARQSRNQKRTAAENSPENDESFKLPGGEKNQKRPPRMEP
jgi:hypothetical protein